MAAALEAGVAPGADDELIDTHATRTEKIRSQKTQNKDEKKRD